MSKYITYGTINANEESLEKAKIKELKYFIREDKDIDLSIEEKMPLSDFGDKEAYLEIGGSKDLIDLFEKIDAKKLDIIERVENVEYKGIEEGNEIVLGFNDDITATGVYDFTREFFEELFEMGKYVNFCIANDLKDLIKENMDELSVKFKDKEKQYRLINKDDKWFIRGITSTKYNNYDNNIAIYLVLLLLNKLAVKAKIGINLKSAYISDSAMKVFFEQDNYVSIEGVGDVCFGVLLTNGEIRNSQFSVEVYYKIVDKEDKSLGFTAIADIKDSVFCVNHTMRVDTLISKIQNISNLLTIEESMLSYIKSIKNLKSISDDILYSMMLKITQSRLLIAETKDKFMDIYDKNLINNSMTLLQIFDKTNQITTDIDERINVQRIYGEIIKEVVNHN